MSGLLQKSAKWLLLVACILLAASLAFTGYSFARFVSRVDSDNNAAGAAPIDCRLTIGDGGDSDTGSFINAPFVQQTGDSRPIRMNNWEETRLTVHNDSRAGLKYSYSLVFYLPAPFADKAMFQLLQHYDEGEKRDEESRLLSVKKASRLYGIRLNEDKQTGTLQEITQIVDPNTKPPTTINLENDYIDLAGMSAQPATANHEAVPARVGKNELKIDTTSSSVTLMPGTQTTDVQLTFTTQYTNTVYVDKDGNVVPPADTTTPKFGTDSVAGKMAGAFAVPDTTSFAYYRVTVNFDVAGMIVYKEDGTVANPDEYILAPGKSKSFELRMVLKSAVDSTEYNKFTWLQPDGNISEQYTKIEILTPTSSEYAFRWRDETKTGVQVAIYKKDADGNSTLGSYYDVTVGACAGLTMPCRAAAVFTQER